MFNKLVYFLTTTSSILSLGVLLDDVFFKSKLIANLSIPETVPTEVYFGTVVFFSVNIILGLYFSTKPVNLPYPDLSKHVEVLENNKEKQLNQISSLEKVNSELREIASALESKKSFEDKLRNRIIGVLTSEKVNMRELTKKLQLDSANSNLFQMLQAELGRMSDEGRIRADSINRYYLVKPIV